MSSLRATYYDRDDLLEWQSGNRMVQYVCNTGQFRLYEILLLDDEAESIEEADPLTGLEYEEIGRSLVVSDLAKLASPPFREFLMRVAALDMEKAREEARVYVRAEN